MPSKPVRQSGVIPYRFRNGRVEVALVTARSGGGWTIPKGHIETYLSPERSAAKEAMEEAGLVGTVGKCVVGTYSYRKNGSHKHVSVFAMKVRAHKRTWPEMQERRRQWFSPGEAASRVRSAELRCVIQGFACRVRRGRV